MPSSSPSDEPASYVPIGPPPGPRHSRATGSRLRYVARVASLCAFALALIIVPMVWVQRDDAPNDTDSAVVADPEDGPAPQADELGFSTSRASDEPSPTVSPSVAPSTAAPPGAPAPPAAPPAPAAPPPAPPTEDPLVVPPPQTALSNDIVSLTNADRAKKGVEPLTTSQCLTDQISFRTAVLVHEDRFE